MASGPVDLALLSASLLVATVLAELLGAANMGIALTFGALAFTAMLLWLLLRGGRSAAQPQRGGRG